MDERERSSLLDQIGGEPLEGSGFEGETPTVNGELYLGPDPEENEQ